MSFVENMRQRVLIGQVGIIVYSLAAALLGKTWKTFVLALLVIILIQIAISKRGKNPLGQDKAPPNEILTDPKLFEESKAYELQMADRELMAEMQEQSKFSLYTSAGMLIAIVYFMVLWKYVDVLHRLMLSFVGDERIAWFLAFLIYFEGLFIINQATMIWALRKIGKVPIIQVPRAYIVTPKGIVIQGLVGKSALRFPLPPGTRVRSSERRKFVEIVRHGERTILRIRLYTRRVRRLEELLRKYGGAEKMEESS